MSRIITGVSSKSWLKLAAVAGYAILMMASLFGLRATRAQSSPTVTPVSSILTVSPATLSFDFQVALPPNGVASKPQNIMLSVAKNQPEPVTIESIMVSDQNPTPPQFIVQANNCTVIQPGATPCKVPIVFQPNGLKKRTAVLLINSNASNVTSAGLVGHAKQGILSINPGSLSFPVAEVTASASPGKSVTLSNRNAAQLTLSRISSSLPEVFLLTNNCPTTLQPSAQCTISVSFKADRNGAIGGKIYITGNAAGPNRVNLSGSGKGSPTPTRTATPTRSPTPSPTKAQGPYPMRAFPVMH